MFAGESKCFKPKSQLFREKEPGNETVNTQTLTNLYPLEPRHSSQWTERSQTSQNPQKR